MKKVLYLLIILLLSVTNALSQSKRIGRFPFELRKGPHTVRVIFYTRAFDSSKHRVGYVASIGNTVDGRKAYGAESIPEAEIASIAFFLDGRRINIPRGLYSDCYDPNLRGNRLTLRFTPDYSTIFVSMWGSDGAGGYNVVWKLRANGRHTRFFNAP